MKIEALAERAATVTHFGGSCLSDRPLRNLKALSFFPALELRGGAWLLIDGLIAG